MKSLAWLTALALAAGGCTTSPVSGSPAGTTPATSPASTPAITTPAITAPAASPAGTQSAGTPGGDGPTGPARPLPWPTPAEAPLDQQATVARYQPVLTDAMVAADHEFGPMTWQSRTAFRRSLNGSCTLSLTARGYDNPSLHGQRTATWVERSNQVMARHGFEPVVPWSSAGGESVLASTQRGENVAYSVYWLSGMLILVEVGAAPQQCP